MKLNTLLRAADFLYSHSPAGYVAGQRDTLLIRGRSGDELADALFSLLFTVASLPGAAIRLVRLMPEDAKEAELEFICRNEEGIAAFARHEYARGQGRQLLSIHFLDDSGFDAEKEQGRIAWAVDLDGEKIPAGEGLYSGKDIPDRALDEENCEVLRIARRVHTAYTASWNSRYTEDEITADLYKDADGAAYNLRSSLRLAVSVPWRLAALGITDDGNVPEKLWKEINDKNGKSRDLLAWLEHRSWLAFMILDGWREPTGEELEGYLFRDGNDYRNKTAKLHPCLCDLEEDDWNTPHKKSLKNTQVHRWSKVQDRPEDFCLMDRMSLKIHHLCKERVISEAYEEKMYDLFRNLETALIDAGFGVNGELVGLAHRAENMFMRLRENETNSFGPWQQACREFLEQLGEGEDKERIRKAFSAIRTEAEIAVERNRYRDYKETDVQIIRWLPWILSQERVRTIWKLHAAGNLLENLLSAIILRPAQLHILCEERKIRTIPVDAFRKMLKQHGTGETEILVSPLSKLEEETVPAGPCDVVDVTGCGEMQNRLRIPAGARVVYYGNDDLQDKKDAPFFAPLYHPYDFAMTVHEVFRLKGKELLSDSQGNEILGMEGDYRTLWQARWDVRKNIRHNQAWHYTIRALQLAEKENHLEIWRKKDSKCRKFQYEFPPERYGVLADNGVIRTLQELESAGCISGLLIDPDRGEVSCLVFPGRGPGDPYAETEKNLTAMLEDDREDSWYVFDHEFAGDNTACFFINLAEPVRLKDPEEIARQIWEKDKEEADKGKREPPPSPETIRDCFTEGIRILARSGLLLRLETGIYAYKSLQVRRGLEKEGAALEAYVYYTLFLSGRFDDVRCNVRVRNGDSLSGNDREKELDILVSRKGRIGLVSCKDTTRFDFYHVGELRMQADKYAVNAQPFLACTGIPDVKRQDMCENVNVILLTQIDDSLPVSIISMMG